MRFTADDGGKIWLCVDPLRAPQRLDELTYKQIGAMIDDSFLNQKVRAAALEGVKLSSIDDENGEMVFMVKSSEHNEPNKRGTGLIYANSVRFVEWKDVVDEEDMKPIERARLLMFDGNLQLNCTCPSFLYHGYRFLLTKHNASIFPEPRPPEVRNPQQRGIVCKHMNRVIRSFPFHSGKLAAHIKQKHHVIPGNDQAWDLKTRIAKALQYDKTLEVDYKDVT